VSHNPKSFVKPNKQRQPKQKRKKEQANKHRDQQTENINNQDNKDVLHLSIEEQLECFADLLIDLYLLEQQLSNDHED
jgi:hypothetical protein